jgi:hypothetical protein
MMPVTTVPEVCYCSFVTREVVVISRDLRRLHHQAPPWRRSWSVFGDTDTCYLKSQDLLFLFSTMKQTYTYNNVTFN